MVQNLAAYLLFVVYRLLQWSWRIEINEHPEVKKLLDEGKPFVIAHWHGDELGILHLLKRYHVACIISTSKDGEIMNKAVRLLGGQTVRGSSTRGGTQALKGILRLKAEGFRPSVAVDGPKGPIYQVKPGILQISRLTHLPIYPLTFAASKSYIFEKSWNKSQLPRPFARVVIEWGEQLPPLGKNSDPKDPQLAKNLAELIHSAKQKAVNQL